jgi:spore maturation protein A
VQIVPPVLLVALMGLQINRLFFPILICTALSLVVGILAARWLSKFRGFGDSDPMRAPAGAVEG